MHTSTTTSEELLLSIFIFAIGVVLAYGGISSVFSVAYLYSVFFLFVCFLVASSILLNDGNYPLGKLLTIKAVTKPHI